MDDASPRASEGVVLPQLVIVDRPRPVSRLMKLLRRSEEEGYRHLRRLVDDLRTGANTFERRGEELYALELPPDPTSSIESPTEDSDFVGVVGLNDNGDGRGRLRRLYIDPTFRQRGLGARLVQACVAASLFPTVVVNAGNPEARAFYDHLGWNPSNEVGITHTFRVG